MKFLQFFQAKLKIFLEKQAGEISLAFHTGNDITNFHIINNKSLIEMPQKSKVNFSGLINKLDENELRAVLKNLAVNENIAEKIGKMAIDYLKEDLPEINVVAGRIQSKLESIDTEYLFDRSGPSRHGYSNPNEESWIIFEEVLQPNLDQMRKYHKLKLFDEEKIYCMGIILGLYRFEKESDTDFKDWAVDAPKEFFDSILEGWQKKCKNQEYFSEMDKFLKENCSEFM